MFWFVFSLSVSSPREREKKICLSHNGSAALVRNPPETIQKCFLWAFFFFTVSRNATMNRWNYSWREGSGGGGADSFETKWIFKVCFVLVSANKGEFNYETKHSDDTTLFIYPPLIVLHGMGIQWAAPSGRHQSHRVVWMQNLRVNILKSPQILVSLAPSSSTAARCVSRTADTLIGRRTSREASGCSECRNGADQV